MDSKYPPFAVFPDLNCIIRLPTGTTLRGKLRQHPSTKEPGEHWHEGWVRADDKDAILAGTNLRDKFNRDGLRPEYFHAQSTVEPLRVKHNRIPKEQRTEKNADTLLSELWTPEGLWTIVSSPSDSSALLIAGSVLPSKHELTFEGSRIKQYQPEAKAESETVPPPAAKPAKARPGARPA